jgi:anti-sigma factor RsiW
MAAVSFTDAELLAYLDEQLPVARSAELERALRGMPALAKRLEALLAEEERTDLSLEAVWRRRRLSCPSRSTWALYVADGLGDALKRYLDFHLHTVGCRSCAANVDDLRRGLDPEAPRRTRRVFETSIGRLKTLPAERRS